MKINEEGVGKTTADPENDIVQNICSDDDEEKSSTNRNPKGASLFQTALNIAKLCMGTGTLALPFASQKGGLVFNVVGLGLIGLWNYYSACCLLRCLELLPVELRDADSCDRSGNNCEGVAKCVQIDDGSERKNIDSYGALDRNDENNSDIEKTHAPNQKLKKQPIIRPPPEGTTAYGTVAWYASGPKGLFQRVFPSRVQLSEFRDHCQFYFQHASLVFLKLVFTFTFCMLLSGLLVLDLLMLLLFVGLLIAYEVAMMSFITDMPITTGSNKVDLLIPSVIVSLLSCAPDISFLSNFSALGLLALALSFTVIAWQGVDDNGLYGFYHMDELNLFPKNWTDASSWFGVVAFGYGIVPVIFNIRDSMAQPEYVQPSTKIGLIMVFVGYITISNGVRILFSPAHVFDGDVLQAMPDTWISFIVRLLMTFVVAVTAPLIVVPCGELIEGKLGIDETDHFSQKVTIRVLLCVVCTILAEYAPGFVHIVSFIGCFCVAIAGFVLPPLFSIQLALKQDRGDHDFLRFKTMLPSLISPQIVGDLGLLVVGVAATVITSILTFIEMIVE